MRKLFYTLITALFFIACTGSNDQLASRDPFNVPDKAGYCVKGVVFDEYYNPIEGVVVSDGLLTTKTDRNGWFWLDSDLSVRRFVSVTVPSGFEVPSEDGVPRFFERIPDGATSYRAEFHLQSRRDNGDRYTIFMVGDPQIRRRTAGYDKFAYHSIDMFEDMCRDMNEVCSTITDRPVYAIGLGDLTHEDASMWETYLQGMKTLKFPMFGVIGNHDHNTYAMTEPEAIRPYEDNIGPTNYSFDLGRLHFICLDNIIMKCDGSRGYTDGLTDEVFTYLCNDLKYVPKDKIIMICSHSSMFGKPGKDPVDGDKHGQDYARVLSQYKYVHSWAGHSHINFNKVYSKVENRLSNIEGHIVARATGALWLNEWVCSDGTPRGYYVVDVDGEDIRWYYHPCGNQLGVANGFDDEYQMRAYAPGDYDDNYVYVNVWGWDALWGNVSYSDNGKAGRPMAKIVTYDKAYKDCCDLSNSKPGNLAKEEFKPDKNVQHIFRIIPTSGATSCDIEVTDRFGRTYSTSLDWGSDSAK
ncbi:MAG: calcineurin-like phosphoesterase C-terminal domain-containing protein [Alistipes sp.]|nr:calcineurin-like phosphoesterase C-terminal domain-containing protein [Alistipes sp.]